MNAADLKAELKQLLNESQFKAAIHKDGPLLILAGAGSGKTRVITYRVAYLLTCGISYKNILCLTFTNKAAGEMKERVKDIVGKDEKLPRISTFHSFCLWILKSQIHHLGFKNKFNIYNSSDQYQMLYDILKEKRIDASDEMIETFRGAISDSKNKNISPEEYPVADDTDKAIKIIYSQYQSNMKQYNAIDFDDMIYYCIRLLKDRPDLLMRYRKRFKYIMIDEYQDTNRAQYILARLLTEKHRNLAVVGDDDQSIYGWRGADISNILNFEKDMPDAVVVKLEKNYRSTSSILRAANAVIKNNEQRKDKELRSVGEIGDIIETIEAEDPMEEARMVADDIALRCLKFGRKHRQFAVLYRTNSQSKPLETIFNQSGIPFNNPGGINFYDRKEIRDTLAYLKLLNNSGDDISLLRIINFPKRGIGTGTLKTLREKALEKDLSLFDTIPMLIDGESNIKVETLKELEHFRELILNYGESVNGKEMGEMFKEFLTNICFYDEFFKVKTDSAIIEKKIKNIEMLVESINSYATRRKKPTLNDFLLKLALMLSNPDEDEMENAENKVHFSTIHAAKGLEYPYVYIVGMEDNMLPFVRDENSGCNINEERRLCYVAITRAEKELTFSLCRRRRNFQGERANPPSKFLGEIPDDCIIRNYGEHGGGLKKSDNSSDDISEIGFSKLKSLFN